MGNLYVYTWGNNLIWNIKARIMNVIKRLTNRTDIMYAYISKEKKGGTKDEWIK